MERVAIIISDSGKRHLGSALGSDDFVAGCVRDKVTSWVSEIEKLRSCDCHLVASGGICCLYSLVFYIVGLIYPRLLQGLLNLFTCWMMF